MKEIKTFGALDCPLGAIINRALLSETEKATYFVKFNVDGLLRGVIKAE